MKKYIFLINFFIVIINTTFAQNLINTNIQSKIQNIELEIQAQKRLNLEQKSVIDDLQKKLNAESMDRVFNQWMSIQQMLIAFLGLLSLLLPFLTYFFGYKPAKEAEKRIEKIESEFEEIVKERLEKFITEKESNEMKTAISNLLSNDPELKSIAINYINLNQYYQVDDTEKRRIYEALLNPSISEQAKFPMRVLLANGKSIWADLYFENIITSEK